MIKYVVKNNFYLTYCDRYPENLVPKFRKSTFTFKKSQLPHMFQSIMTVVDIRKNPVLIKLFRYNTKRYLTLTGANTQHTIAQC